MLLIWSHTFNETFHWFFHQGNELTADQVVYCEDFDECYELLIGQQVIHVLFLIILIKARKKDDIQGRLPDRVLWNASIALGMRLAARGKPILKNHNSFGVVNEKPNTQMQTL